MHTDHSCSPKPAIIFAEDNELILEFFQRFFTLLLDANQYDLVLTASVDRVLQECERRHVALVITDYLLPAMNGLQLHAAIRRISPQIPVVLITGNASSDLEREAFRQGIQGFLAKPFSPQKLQQIIQSVLPTIDQAKENTPCATS